MSNEEIARALGNVEGKVDQILSKLSDLEKNAHIVPCKPLSFLQGQLWMVWALFVVVLPIVVSIAVKVWAK